MALTISDEFIDASQLTPPEFLQEIALYLFQSGRLTLGYAAKMAEMDYDAFKDLLKARNIPLYRYDWEDFEVDFNNLRELGRL
jgi:predicted HTH domain antitoxin